MRGFVSPRSLSQEEDDKRLEIEPNLVLFLKKMVCTLVKFSSIISLRLPTTTPSPLSLHPLFLGGCCPLSPLHQGPALLSRAWVNWVSCNLEVSIVCTEQATSHVVPTDSRIPIGRPSDNSDNLIPRAIWEIGRSGC